MINVKMKPPSALEFQKRLQLLLYFSISLIIFGLLNDSPKEILIGLKKIILDRDTLITDYIKVAGIGAAFVNSGLVTLASVIILKRIKIHVNGAAYAAVFSMASFSMFGKNIFNIWFIIIGVYLFSKIQKEKFSKYIYIALFGTSMSPIGTEFIFSNSLDWYIGIPLGILIGIIIGFVLPPVSSHLLRFHQGYNLYNIGFTAGILSTVVVALVRSYGYNIADTRSIIYTGPQFGMLLYLIALFLAMIIIGYLGNGKSFKNYRELLTYPGRLVTDFILLEGINLTLINMGLTGILSTLYVFIVGGRLNGATLGGILMVVGFSAFGKHVKNILPIFIGVALASIVTIYDIDSTSIIIAALFGTALAPIAGEFGFFFGIIAGYIHLSVVVSIVTLSGGLNLYNNGFSAGLVAGFLVPIITVFRRDEANET